MRPGPTYRPPRTPSLPRKNAVTENAVLVTELMRGKALLTKVHAPDYRPTVAFAHDLSEQVSAARAAPSPLLAAD